MKTFIKFRQGEYELARKTRKFNPVSTKRMLSRIRAEYVTEEEIVQVTGCRPRRTLKVENPRECKCRGNLHATQVWSRESSLVVALATRNEFLRLVTRSRALKLALSKKKNKARGKRQTLRFRPSPAFVQFLNMTATCNHSPAFHVLTACINRNTIARVLQQIEKTFPCFLSAMVIIQLRVLLRNLQYFGRSQLHLNAQEINYEIKKKYYNLKESAIAFKLLSSNTDATF